jgi:hypothetical protein
MARFRAPVSRNPFRRATAHVVLISLLLALLASDRLHNHPRADDHLTLGAPGTSGVRLAAAPGPTVPGRALPCPACLYHRTFSVDPSERAPEGRQVAVSLAGRVPVADSPPRAAPVIARTGPRAPPA